MHYVYLIHINMLRAFKNIRILKILKTNQWLINFPAGIHAFFLRQLLFRKDIVCWYAKWLTKLELRIGYEYERLNRQTKYTYKSVMAQNCFRLSPKNCHFSAGYCKLGIIQKSLAIGT